MPTNPSLHIKAWKMVDAIHADSVARGVLRLGSLESYKELENGRGDAGDGVLTINVDHLEVTDLEKDKAKLERIGFGFSSDARLSAGAKIIVSDTVYREHPPPVWVFCMAEEGCEFDWDPSVEKAIFEVADVQDLASAIAASVPQLVAGVACRRVVYENTSVDLATGLQMQGSFFRKAPKYACEREIRIAFKPREWKPVGPIFTPENGEIARLLRRVR